MGTQVVSMAAIQRGMSAERIAKYYRKDSNGEVDGDVEAVARYLWNVALQSTLVPALHAAELTIRNAVFDASVRVANWRGRSVQEINCWLDATPSLLFRKEETAVADAKDHLRANPRSMTPGHLVAKLSFGFWVNLLNSAYEQGRTDGPALWPRGAKMFQGVPSAERNRVDLRRRFDAGRRFRNRVFHHEPIWDQEPARDYEHVLETLRHLNPGISRAVHSTCLFPATWQKGAEAYLGAAEQLLGQPRRALAPGGAPDAPA